MTTTTELAPTPGSAAWLRFMTASKIAAVVGTSPYESRFSLWHRMSGDLPQQEQNAQMGVGHVLEPALLAWFQTEHLDVQFRPGAWVVHPRIGWAAATPDGFAGDDALVEAKTARDGWEWRQDEDHADAHRRVGVPAGYYDQCQWQMWVTGRTTTHVVALVDMGLVERTITVDRGRIEYLIDAAETFMTSLDTQQAPPIDGSTHTYMAVRELHPDINGEDVQIPADLAVAYITAKANLDDAKTAERLHTARLIDALGDGRRALVDTTVIARRQQHGRGGVALYQVTKTTTDLTQETPA